MGTFKVGDKVRFKDTEQEYVANRGLEGEFVVKKVEPGWCGQLVWLHGVEVGSFARRLELVKEPKKSPDFGYTVPEGSVPVHFEDLKVGDIVTWGSKETFYEVIGRDDKAVQFGGYVGCVYNLPSSQWARKVTPVASYEEPTADPAADLVANPKHYTDFEIEPVDFIMKNKLTFEQGNVIKYTCRAGRKIYDGKDAIESEITDLKKAARYIELRIDLLEGLR